MNKLSFKTEYVDLAQGDQMGKYLALEEIASKETV